MAGVNIAMRGACSMGTCDLTPRTGCCFEDGECGSRSQRCVNEMCVADGEGTCVTNLLMVGQCWENTDCATGETCEGERVCPCGAACILPDAPGRCTPSTTTPCTDNSMCAAAQYCQKREGDCTGNGACTVRPRVCPLVFQPVCGCDGMTYDNGCLAARAGVSVASQGPCETMCALRPATGCCFDDADCSTRNTRCVGEACIRGGEGTCVTTVLADGRCWEDSDCTGRLAFCQGAVRCPCGALCLRPDAPGTCTSIGITP